MIAVSVSSVSHAQEHLKYDFPGMAVWLMSDNVTREMFCLENQDVEYRPHLL